MEFGGTQKGSCDGWISCEVRAEKYRGSGKKEWWRKEKDSFLKKTRILMASSQISEGAVVSIVSQADLWEAILSVPYLEHSRYI